MAAIEGAMTRLERLCTLILTGSSRCRLYGLDHRLTREALDALFDALTPLLAEEREIRLVVSGDEVTCGVDGVAALAVHVL